MKRITFLLLLIVTMMACNNNQKQFQDIVDTLNTSAPLELENISKARKLIAQTKNLSDAQVATLQDLFINYLIACADAQAGIMEEAYGSALNTADAEQAEIATDSLNTEMEKLRNYGILMYSSETSITTEIMPMFFAETFWHYLTPSEQKIAELSELEIEVPSQTDASISISYDEIAQRLKMCDDMIAQFPDDALLPQIVACQKYYLMLLLVGTENSPVFDWQTNRLTPQIEQIVEIYIDEYPEAKSTPILQEFLEIVRKNKQQKTAEIDDFVAKHEL